jgi:hypothetical protein
MATRVSCPVCKAVHTLPDEYLGKRLRCKHCQGVYVAPAQPSPVDPAAKDEGIIAGRSDPPLAAAPRPGPPPRAQGGAFRWGCSWQPWWAPSLSAWRREVRSFTS